MISTPSPPNSTPCMKTKLEFHNRHYKAHCSKGGVQSQFSREIPEKGNLEGTMMSIQFLKTMGIIPPKLWVLKDVIGVGRETHSPQASSLRLH